jgi:hypothetical protein
MIVPAQSRPDRLGKKKNKTLDYDLQDDAFDQLTCSSMDGPVTLFVSLSGYSPGKQGNYA